MKRKLRIVGAALAAGAALWLVGHGRAADESAPPPSPPGAAAATAPAMDLDNLPTTIFDDSVGDWVVDRFAGNSLTGSVLYQGPAREVGGLCTAHAPGQVVAAPDGTVYIMCGLSGGSYERLVEVSPDGTLRLLMGEKGLIEGPIGQCRASRPLWNPKENTLYLAGLNCIRKVVKKPDGSSWVELVAGIPYKAPEPKAPPKDGPAKQATLQSFYRGAVCNSRGTIFWLEDRGLRKIDSGTVSSIPLKFTEKTYGFHFIMRQNLLSLGEDDDTLYISDTYGGGHQRVLKCDVKTGTLTRVCGINTAVGNTYKRFGKAADGPPLSHASENSGITGHYDPFYNALWINGPDARRMRWMKLDGDRWVRTVMCAARPETKPQPFGLKELNSLGVPGEQVRCHYIYYAGTDSRGGLYLVRWTETDGVWRAYNKKEAKP
ncbi:MAG: hypothetical protein AMK72_07365 [Planctomycetes bacterium SM23_25]|nr:MAG: hypothetical protein AMK72_07365 [Planctomycetes bacterium SM23_25]